MRLEIGKEEKRRVDRDKQKKSGGKVHTYTTNNKQQTTNNKQQNSRGREAGVRHYLKLAIHACGTQALKPLVHLDRLHNG